MNNTSDEFRFMKYWLLKTEPGTYSWEDLKSEPDRTTTWEGIRNYQARNYIRDEIRRGDQAFIYHSVIKPGLIMGIAEIVSAAYTDPFAFETGHKYFDPKSDPANPRWFMMDVRASREFDHPISIDELRSVAGLEKMVLLNNTRLSVQPVRGEEWELLLKMRKIISL